MVEVIISVLFHLMAVLVDLCPVNRAVFHGVIASIGHGDDSIGQDF